jgi:hypothetical protein
METNVKIHSQKQGLNGITCHWDTAPSHKAKVTMTSIASISELGTSQM